MTNPRRIVPALLASLLAAAPLTSAHAAPAVADEAAGTDTSPRLVGKDAGWSVYTFASGKNPVCYALANAATRPAPADKHGGKVATAKQPPSLAGAHLMVTHRPADKALDVVSITFATGLSQDGSADVRVAGQSFDFFTRAKTAWSRDPDTDRQVVRAMSAAASLDATAPAAKGKPVSVHYDLTGFPKALSTLDKACHVKRASPL